MSVYGLYLGSGIYIIGAIISFVVLYFVVKHAVKAGILRAYSIISGKEVKDLHGWETSSEGADTYEKKQE